MEALSGVNAALLCIYDLSKAVNPVLSLSNIRLNIKKAVNLEMGAPDFAAELSQTSPVSRGAGSVTERRSCCCPDDQ